MSIASVSGTTSNFESLVTMIRDVAITAGWTVIVDRSSDTMPALVLHSTGENDAKDIWAQITLHYAGTSYKIISLHTMYKWVATGDVFDMTGVTSLTYDSSGNSITKVDGAGFDTFFQAGDRLTIWNSKAASANGGTRIIQAVTANTLTLPSHSFSTTAASETNIENLIFAKGGGAYNLAGDTFSSNSTSSVYSPYTTTTGTYIVSASKDFVCCVFKYSTTTTSSLVGTYTSAFSESRATTTTEIQAGNYVTVDVDDVLPEFAVGRSYILISTAGCERVCITQIRDHTLTLFAVAYNHPIGAHIGEDPCTNVFVVPLNTSRPALVCTTFAQQSTVDDGLLCSTNYVGFALSLGSYDGALVTATTAEARYGRYQPFPMVLYSSPTISKEIRGTLDYVFKSGATLTPDDTMIYKNMTLRTIGGTNLVPVSAT